MKIKGFLEILTLDVSTFLTFSHLLELFSRMGPVIYNKYIYKVDVEPTLQYIYIYIYIKIVGPMREM